MTSAAALTSPFCLLPIPPNLLYILYDLFQLGSAQGWCLQLLSPLPMSLSGIFSWSLAARVLIFLIKDVADSQPLASDDFLSCLCFFVMFLLLFSAF